MSKLRAVKPVAASASKPKVLLYGAPGVGKTWFALDFKASYFIDTEGGANLPHYINKLEASGGVYMGPEQGALSFDTVLEQVQALAIERHPYRTLIIDSISKLFGVAIADEAKRLADAGKKNEFGADKRPATAAMRQLVAWLTRMDLNVLLIAHQKDEWSVSGKSGEREVVGQTFNAWEPLEYELHLCLQIVKAGPSRIARIRKSRLEGFPGGESFPLSYDEFANRYGRHIIDSEVKQIEIATPEQVAEIARLLDVVKLPDGQVSKWLAAASAETWNEVDTDKAAKVIDALKAKLTA